MDEQERALAAIEIGRGGGDAGPRQHHVRVLSGSERADRFRSGAIVLDGTMVGSKGRPGIPAPIGR